MKKIKEILPYVIILPMAIVLILMSNTFPTKKVGTFWDAAVYLNVSKNLTEGQTLYKDIVDNKGPVLYFINYIGLKLGGPSLVCVIEFLFIYIALVYMYKTLQLINKNKIISLLTVGVAFICYAKCFTYGLSCETFALTFSMIAMYKCLQFYENDKFTKLQCLLIGILFGLTFFIRANLIIVFVAFGLGIAIKLIMNKRIKELFEYILFSFLGFIIVCIPIFAYLLINNCVYDFIKNVFLINTTMNKIGLIRASKLMRNMMPISYYSICLYIAVAWWNVLNKKEKYISTFCLGIITILFNSISVNIYYHYFISFLPILILAYNFIIDIIIKKLKIVGYILIIVVIILYTYKYYKLIFVFETFQPNNNVIAYIQNNTEETDRIAVIGFYDEIYYLSNRKPASRITYILSNNAFERSVQEEMVQEYIDDIRKNKPIIIVEDESTIQNIIKSNIDISKYEELKNSEYTYVQTLNNKKIYKLIK